MVTAAVERRTGVYIGRILNTFTAMAVEWGEGAALTP